MNKIKRFSSLVLCVLMLVSMLAVCQISFAFAETDGDYTYTVNLDNTVTITDYTGSDTVVTVPETLGEQNYPVSEIGNSAFENCVATQIILPATVTKIADIAFKGCASLTAITLPDALISVGAGAFVDCAKLESLNFGQNVTSIGSSVVSGCTSLKELTVPFVGTSVGDANSFADLFDGKKNPHFPTTLTKIIVTNDETIDAGAFAGMSSLTEVVWMTDAIKIGAEAFKDCSALADIPVSDALFYVGKDAVAGTKWLANQPDGAIMLANVFCAVKGNVTDVIMSENVVSVADGAMADSLVQTVIIPSTVSYIGEGILSGANDLKSLTIAYVGSSAEEASKIAYLFGVNTNSEIPASLTTVVIDGFATIPAEAFSGCTAITTVTVGADVTEIQDSAFASCSALKTVNYNAANAAVAANAFSGCNNISNVVFGDTVEIIPTNLCTGNSAMTSVTIPENVTTISAQAFANCYKLATVNFDAIECTSVAEGAFEYCHSLKNIVLGDQVTYIPANLYSVYGGSTITELTIPETVTGIAANAFSGCTALTTVNFNAPSCVIGDSAFAACTNLKEIKLGAQVATIPTNLYTGNSSIESVTVPSTVTSIEDYAFMNCTSLLQITVPETLTAIGTKILDGTKWYDAQKNGAVYLGNIFYGYKGDVIDGKIVIANGTTAIATAAFKGNSTLNEVFIPNSVTYIGANAFELTDAMISCYASATDVITYARENGIVLNILNCDDANVYYEIVTQATATQDGSWMEVCLDCGQQLGVSSYALADAANVWVLTTEATCTTTGVITKGSETASVPAKGHGASVWKQTMEPTCAVYGVVTEYCADCGAAKGGTTAVEKTAHTAGVWENIKAARTYCTGLDAILCTECGEILKSKTIAKLSEEVDLSAFTDLPEVSWYYESVKFAVANSLFVGKTTTEFAPDDAMTRAMFVTVLGRLHGVTVDNNVNTKFTDVKSGKYYTGYLAWAVEAGIITGITETSFAPDASVTREQICAIVYRYCTFAGIALNTEVEEVMFRDADVISQYAYAAVTACQRGGLVQGTGNNYFNPKAGATRAQVAQILKNLATGYLAE